ncbi:MAG: glycosyltransferase family 4 protein [Acidobacteriota bacterium]|nr:glycosyltransferase family 4 protein [Acidobacteriota bacterium]
MKIALDATYSLGRHLSGVGVYSREMMSGLAAAHANADFEYCYRPHRFLRSFQQTLPGNVRRRLLWSGLAGDADVFHGLNQRVDDRRWRRIVTTFHDLFVLSAEYSTAEFRHRFTEQARGAAERSDLIIAVSEFTARQVVELLGVDRERIRVVHHGVHARAAASTSGARENVILFVGAIQKRKNLDHLVRAFEGTARGWKLVLAGSTGFGGERILQKIERSRRRSDIEVTGYIPDATLERWYARARVFAFPSLDEGFGMPVLDAMARGVPVLTSNRSALPEVAGDAALLVDPENEDEIAVALMRLTSDERLRDDLALKGLARSAGFSWEAAVEKTWSVYGEVS